MEPLLGIENSLAKKAVDCAYRVHTALGPGLLESVYEKCLFHELSKQNLSIETQVRLPVIYDGVQLDAGLRLDIWMERKVILELKSTEELTPLHQAQLLTYLKLTGNQLGLLINFNTPLIKHGIRRLVLSR
ncbi:GxxExxY protein [Ruficoccus sp. ZRK36]|uniref:GxxExxY protein n=1 Tax=Ruficoccus sp. ZRK36 TaxID=2866311 RepID=UPI001C73B170|nr:GxxExxY protein [Ruficoccus sp. ZRK36]QYY37333.1 GxxExxY protein [Ruficoccus sp. ZRK36]